MSAMTGRDILKEQSYFQVCLAGNFDTLSFVGVRPFVNLQTKTNSYHSDISLSQDFILGSIPFN